MARESHVTTRQVCVRSAVPYHLPMSSSAHGVERCTPVTDMKVHNVETVRSIRRILTWISVLGNALASITFTRVSPYLILRKMIVHWIDPRIAIWYAY